MLEKVSQRYQGSCMMVMRQSGKEVTFLASSFLVHPSGYLLTVNRAVGDGEGLVVVPPVVTEDFDPVTHEEVAPVPAEVAARDSVRDVALLKLKPEMEINMPEKILGAGDSDARGAQLMSLGIPFGHYRIHSVCAAQAILAGRVCSHGGTKLIIFDRRVQHGDLGGPLISVADGQVIGVVDGVFDPVALEGRETPEGTVPINSDLSYAVSIEYGAALLESVFEAGEHEG
jgi:serine protease Do